MKTKLIFLIIIFSFAGLAAQQKAKMQKADESGFIEVDEIPVLKSQLKPAYPEIAKLAGIEGTVYLKLLIDEKGNVADAKVEQGAKEMLDNSALNAARQAKFSPAVLNDKPVKVWVILPVAFKLSIEKKEVQSGKEKQDEYITEAFDKAPELINAVTPVYPEEAKVNKITGNVYVKVLVGKDGIPQKTIIIKSDAQFFNQPSIDAVMKSKFSPALQKNKPVAVWIVLPYKFALDEGSGKEKK